ncbi:hypothetical protein CTI12_AA044980 [Artemisia annua]|uniref:Zinc finger PMZ-type domain-containing protein n=1 Tax=Artemisia annua TaxID=35608 RepID=A0A2U1QD20_ARTAN|nr:hypothetical protein CTI12_AA044980 [Artemisia annua]
MEANTSRMVSLNVSNYHVWKGKMEDFLYVKDYYLPVFSTEKPENKTNAEWTILHRQINTPLNRGIKELKTHVDVEAFLKCGYENKWMVSLYTEHFEYDVLDFLVEEKNDSDCSQPSDECASIEEEDGELDYVDFQIEGEDNVVIPNKTTTDPFLNKLCSNNLVQRNPNSWCKAFFALSVKCVAFENGICERYHRAIVVQRSKPIITMLEDIRVYLMQRLVAMSKLAQNLEDTITPSIRKHLEYLKLFGGHHYAIHQKALGVSESRVQWIVYPNGYMELKVKKGDESFGVNLQLRMFVCRLWQLSGVPCIYAVCWVDAVEQGIDEGKHTNNQPPLPLIIRKMPGRPRKKRIRTQVENNSHVSRVGRRMTCSNGHEVGHNKGSCEKEPIQNPLQKRKHLVGKKQADYGCFALARGARGSRGGSSGGVSESSSGRGESSGGRCESSGGRGSSGDRGSMGSGRCRSGGGRGLNQSQWIVYPNGYMELKVKKGDESFGVNLQLRMFVCRLWQLSGVPNAVVGKMPGRPRKKRIRTQVENNSHVSRVGRRMTWSNGHEVGHNKARGARGSRGGRGGSSGGVSESSSGRGESSGGRCESSGGRGLSGDRGSRGSGRCRSGGGRGLNQSQFMDEEEIRKNLEHEYLKDLMD